MECGHSTLFRCKFVSLNATVNDNVLSHHRLVPGFEKAVLTIACFILLLGVIGNVLIVYIVPKKDMRSVCNVFVANLAIRDVFFLVTFGLAWIVDHVIYVTRGNELQVMPLISVYALTVTILATSGLLVALAIDRYQSIGHPLQSRSKKSFYLAYVVTAIIWVVSFMLPLVHPIMKTTDSTFTWLMVVITNTAIAYVLPLATVIILYIIIVIAVRRGQQESGESNHLTRWEFKRKIRVLRMVGYVILLFSLAWGVWWGFNIYLAYERYKNITITVHQEVAMDVADLLVLATSAINPFIYGITDANFHRHLKKILCWSCAPRSLQFTATAETSKKEMTPIGKAEYSVIARRYSHSNGSSEKAAFRKSFISTSIESIV